MQGLKSVGLLCVALACLAYAEDAPSAPAQYEFNYAVNDPTTGDQKDQQETRNGDDVVGFYRTVDSDGYLRTVRYKADAVNGFTAEVLREPVSGAAGVVPVPADAKAVVKPAVVPVVAPAPVVVRAPVVAPAPAVLPYVAPAPFPYVAPAAVPYAAAAPAPYYFGSSGYNYQPYPYASYSPYSYGQYPFGSQYSYGSQYPYAGQYSSTVFRK